jgi:hypothetical protein
LVDSHACGAQLNELGIAAPGYKTQDIDVVRAQPLAVALADDATMEALLKETGLNFVPSPACLRTGRRRRSSCPAPTRWPSTCWSRAPSSGS